MSVFGWGVGGWGDFKFVRGPKVELTGGLILEGRSRPDTKIWNHQPHRGPAEVMQGWDSVQ